MKLLVLSAFCAFAFANPGRAADDKKAVEDLVRKTVDEILVIQKNKELSRDKKRKRVMKVIDGVVDFPLMAKLSLGKTQWEKIDAKERQTFTNLFVETLKTSYFEKLDFFTDESVEFSKAVQIKNKKGKKQRKFTVATYIVSKGERIEVAYKLYDKKGVWQGYDFEIEGVSVLKSYSSQYKEFLREDSFEGLVARMKEKIEAEKKKQKPDRDSQKAAAKKATKE